VSRAEPRPVRLWRDELDTPLGPLTLVADDDGRLRAVGWCDGGDRRGDRCDRMAQTLDAWAPRLARARDPGGLTSALRAYFGGELAAIDELPVVLDGTPFQETVWRALRRIPCGETRSYGELARAIGKPAAVRAVGLANGSNPIGVVVPCHRVIGTDGSLTGYGGGLHRKRWLLAHERGPLPLFTARTR
jgi:methylated-DNA-[protein]-cysteine S-methyltransferase